MGVFTFLHFLKKELASDKYIHAKSVTLKDEKDIVFWWTPYAFHIWTHEWYFKHWSMEDNIILSQIFTNIAGQCRAVPIYNSWDIVQIIFQI